MITPRRTRLWRAPDLAGFRRLLIDAISALGPIAASDTFVWVPTRGAGEQLRRTLEDGAFASGASALVLPDIGTRSDLYAALANRLAEVPSLASAFERDVIMAASARDAEDAGIRPPFHVRPTLVAEMLALYDQVRRLGRSVADLDRLIGGELEPAADSDRGAAQLLEQTRFLVAAFNGYEARLAESGGLDEHTLRARALGDAALARPIRRLLVTIGDRLSDADGYWPIDAAMLTAIGGLEELDLLSTDAMLDAGYLDRVRLAFLDIEEQPGRAGGSRALLIVPEPAAPTAERTRVFSYRDREDELEAVARRLKSERREGRRSRLDRTALVVSRPLPYLYVARDILGRAGIPFEAVDTLPLAAEPYAAALDLVLDFAASDFTRRSAVALLRSPHFRFEDEGTAVAATSVTALDAALAGARFLGSRRRLSMLAGEWSARSDSPHPDDRRRRVAAPAARAAAAAATALEPLLDSRPLVEQIQLLQAFLSQHDRTHHDESAEDERGRRVRAAIAGALDGLADAHRRHDPAAAGTVHDLVSMIRRWLGAQTFAARTGEAGLQIVDPQSARFGQFDDVQLLGLVDGEWPELAPRNMFYPRSLIAQLEPQRPDQVEVRVERDLLRAARAAFRDLAGLASLETRLSTFALEADAVVEPSVLLEDVDQLGLETRTETIDLAVRVFTDEALAFAPPAIDHLPPAMARWARARLARPGRDDARFKGQAGPWVVPRVSVSRLERYAKCPFQFFAAHVLRLDEEPEDEDTRSPLERGRFLHEVFEAFFGEWQRRGRGRITPALVGEARTLFTGICDTALASLSPPEAALERARLLGSAVGAGIGDCVFAMEAERPVEVRRRLLEYPVEGEFTFTAEDGSTRTISLSAKVDRVDLLEDGSFRLIDYKTKYVPELWWALQLPVYCGCARARLSRGHGRDVPPSEAMYLSFEGDRSVVPLKAEQGSLDPVIRDAEHRLVAALDGIAAGEFPPRPAVKSLCNTCPFVAVCRTPGGLPDGGQADLDAPPESASREAGADDE